VTQPTQVRHPWRATVRTVFAAAIALLSLLPVIAVAGHVDTVAWVSQLLAVAAGITRVLALPGVNDWLRRYAGWLAADH
jgi:hypothetical protein